MANRDLNFTPTYTQVTAEEPNNIELGLSAVAAKVADASEQSKVLANTAQAHVQYKTLDMQFRQQYADDPTNPEGLKALGEARKDVTDTLGNNISPFYQREWTKQTTDLATQSQISNEAWGFKQQQKNTINNFQTTALTYTQTANRDGQAFGASPDLDPSAIMNYATSQQQLINAASSVLGADKAAVLAKNFKSDYIKSFISGVAENNPAKAAQLLDNPDIKANFTTEERGEMVDQITRVKKQQALVQSLQVTSGGADVTDIVNNPSTTYFEKRATIDNLDLQGAITPTMAAKARRVIRSSEDLDTQTDTPIMSGIVNQIYDLNAASATNPSDYLHGVRNIQETIADQQAGGQLTARDAGKLNKQLTDLTSKRVSDATQSVGNEFYDANQKFNTLPPEYRAQATRQLFYAGEGKNFTKQDYASHANSIIDDINGTRRAAAQKIAAATSQSDAAFLRAIKASPADVAETARTHGITEKEVISQLRAHAAGAPRAKLSGRAVDTSEDGLGPVGGPVTLRGAADQSDTIGDGTGQE